MVRKSTSMVLHLTHPRLSINAQLCPFKCIERNWIEKIQHLESPQKMPWPSQGRGRNAGISSSAHDRKSKSFFSSQVLELQGRGPWLKVRRILLLLDTEQDWLCHHASLRWRQCYSLSPWGVTSETGRRNGIRTERCKSPTTHKFPAWCWAPDQTLLNLRCEASLTYLLVSLRQLKDILEKRHPATLWNQKSQ